jgi:hypothetical protein
MSYGNCRKIKMKNRIHFLIINSKTGVRRRFSLNKKLLYFMIFLSFMLLGSGAVGTWKYMENFSLREESLLLQAKKRQIEAVARTVEEIQKEETTIRKMLGLEDNNIEQTSN